MYYEEKWIDGWLWFRSLPDAPFEKATAEQMERRRVEREKEAYEHGFASGRCYERRYSTAD